MVQFDRQIILEPVDSRLRIGADFAGQQHMTADLHVRLLQFMYKFGESFHLLRQNGQVGDRSGRFTDTVLGDAFVGVVVTICLCRIDSQDRSIGQVADLESTGPQVFAAFEP